MVRVARLTSLALLCACSSRAPREGEPSRALDPPPTEPTGTARPRPTAPSPTASASSLAARFGGSFVKARGVDVEGAIVPETRAWSFGMTEIGKQKVDGAFTPDEALVAKAEAGLGAALQATKEGKPIAAKLRSYKRQYVGLTAAGKKKLYINAFCSDEPGWLSAPVSVDDGGDCYFQIVYDVESGRFLELSVNGMG